MGFDDGGLETGAETQALLDNLLPGGRPPWVQGARRLATARSPSSFARCSLRSPRFRMIFWFNYRYFFYKPKKLNWWSRALKSFWLKVRLFP